MYSITENYIFKIVEAIPDVKVSIIGGVQINVQ